MSLERIRMIKEKDILKVWDAEQEILDVIHAVCVNNNLRYSLAYGTLLGGVRHAGFIPWDDDIDLIMPREDYEKFLNVWDKEAPKGYILQNGRTDTDFTQTFTKIRKDHTTFIQSDEEKDKKYHKGIFVDIFPGDRVAPGKITNKIQYVLCAVFLLYSRGFTSGSGGLIGLIERILLKIPKEIQLYCRERLEKMIGYWNDNKDCKYFFPNTIEECCDYFDSDIFDEITDIHFRNKKYHTVKDKDKMLQQCYGNYMELPPKEERVWRHHPIVIDFEKNYEELKENS